MEKNLVVICRDNDAVQFDELISEYGNYQIRLSSTSWFVKLNGKPEHLRDEILDRLGKLTTHYIFETTSVLYNTVDSDAAATIEAHFD